MDRALLYPGQIPLDTDQLNQTRNAMVGLAKVCRALFGTNQVFNGLSVGPSSPAALTVDVAPGEIYSLQNLDSNAFGSLPADTTHQIVKQGIMLDKVTLACPAPGTAGQSINYLIQAAFSEVDGGSTVLPYYNASNPAVAYSGPSNSGTAQNTVRQGLVNVTAKAGTAAATGTQTTPAPDSGFVGIAVVTVANGQSTITGGNISNYSGAPNIAAPLMSGRLLNVQVFNSSGTYTPTLGTNSIVVEVQGAGGAGGGSLATSSSQASVGGAGAAGSYAKSRLTSGFAGAAVTIGAGGTGVSGSNGNSGGSSSFGSITAPGGGGGIAGILSSTFPILNGTGIPGAAATGGNIVNSNGDAGGSGFCNTNSAGISGKGGNSVFGGGAPARANSTGNGTNASTPGSGGSGALTLASGAAATGGNGANGIVIVYEYA